MPKLGVNIDHVATLRQARREQDPDPILAACICEQAGAHSIVAHVREDRRHMQDRDILILHKTIKTRFNLEMSLRPDIVDIACAVKPQQATIVPEGRLEITTEGGLDVVRHRGRLKKVCGQLQKNAITVSLFIAADTKQIEAAHDLGIRVIELHTGAYARACVKRDGAGELKKISTVCAFARKLGMTVNAGHGLNYSNVRPIARIEGMEELNIGHSIISRAVFTGLEAAVKEMLGLLSSSFVQRGG
ncbi:MAG: pyridoxine 5'-phosphate synthase [Candidatus Omnitrophica bacterium]|nr:pyridoxine 5'-phosphate synthase [Candidatus Omnitrophota bacterium]